MQVPLKISFHNIDSSGALEERIRQKVDKLENIYSGIIKCEVRVESSVHHRHKGNPYSVHILLTLPKKTIIVSQHPGKNPLRHEKIYAAMNDAFLAVEKKLKQYKQEQRRDVKEHASIMLSGHISMMDVSEGYGFITMLDGTEIYFNKNAVVADHFHDLGLDSKVRFSFIEGEGVEGPQANIVRMIKKKS